MNEESQRKNRKTIKLLLIAVVCMFGFAFALVPLYRVFCQATGVNGRVYSAEQVQADTPIDKDRMITVQFLTTNNQQLPWIFKPEVKSVRIHPGEMKRVTFYVKNKSDHTMTVQAIPSITPGTATRHLHKTECFCFTQQTLGSGEELDMPVMFHVDVDLPKEIQIITLSYTLFDTDIHQVQRESNQGRI